MWFTRDRVLLPRNLYTSSKCRPAFFFVLVERITYLLEHLEYTVHKQLCRLQDKNKHCFILSLASLLLVSITLVIGP